MARRVITVKKGQVYAGILIRKIEVHKDCEEDRYLGVYQCPCAKPVIITRKVLLDRMRHKRTMCNRCSRAYAAVPTLADYSPFRRKAPPVPCYDVRPGGLLPDHPPYVTLQKEYNKLWPCELVFDYKVPRMPPKTVYYPYLGLVKQTKN